MMIRTLSVRVEVNVDVDDKADLEYVRADLAKRAAEAIDTSPRSRRILFASSVLRMSDEPRW